MYSYWVLSELTGFNILKIDSSCFFNRFLAIYGVPLNRKLLIFEGIGDKEGWLTNRNRFKEEPQQIF